jgi:hypothetical protein
MGNVGSRGQDRLAWSRKRIQQALRERREWDAWGELRKSNFDTSLVDEVITACEEGRFYSAFIDYEFLSHCNTKQRDRVCAVAIEKEWWEVACMVLKVGVSETRHLWAVEEASKKADDWQFIKYILPHILPI